MAVALDTEFEILATLSSDTAVRRYYDDGIHGYHFADPACRKIYEWCRGYFETHGMLEHAPSHDVIIAEFPQYDDIISNAKGASPSYLSERLKNEYIKRECEGTLRDLLPMMADDAMGAATMLRNSMSRLVDNCTPESFCIEYAKDIDIYRKRVKEQQDRIGMPYPFKEMTEWTGGIRDGEMCIVVAPAGMGKTCFACKTALEAIRAGHNVYFASLELSIENIAQRIEYMVANEDVVQVPVMDYQKGIRLPQYVKAIADAQEKIISMPGRLVIDQPMIENRTPTALVSSCKAHDCDLIIVDQLQFVTKPKRDTLQESYGAALQEFKQQIMTPVDGRRLPLLLLHQMNREGARNQTKGSGRVGSMTDIAGSAWVEQIADIVWGLGRNEEERNNNVMNIATLKVRNTSPVGWMLFWDTAYSYRFHVMQDQIGTPIRLDNWM